MSTISNFHKASKNHFGNKFTFETKKQWWEDRTLTWRTAGHTVHPAGITELYVCSDSGCSAGRPHTANSLQGRPHTHRSVDWQRNPLDTLTHMFAVWLETALQEKEKNKQRHHKKARYSVVWPWKYETAAAGQAKSRQTPNLIIINAYLIRKFKLQKI